MAYTHYCHYFSQKLSLSAFLPNGNSSFPLLPRMSLSYPYRRFAVSVSSGGEGASSVRFTWDDVSRVSKSPGYHSSDLQCFFDQVKLCNRNSENQNEFMPFVVENAVVGYVHNRFADKLRKFENVFVFPNGNSYGSCFGCHVTLNPILQTPEDRTAAVDVVVKSLGEELIPVISSDTIFWYPIIFLIGKSCSTILRDKGLWSSYEWIC